MTVKELERDVRYTGFYFDPVTGDRKDLPAAAADPSGSRRIEPPAWGHDWVLVLEARK